MPTYVLVILLVLLAFIFMVVGIYILYLKRQIVYYRITLSSLLTDGNLVQQSILFVAEAYGISTEELMTIIENYQNTTGERK